jgi:glycosyltransferase involved in cell wall biosynthesis
MLKGSGLVDFGIRIYERAFLPRIVAKADKVVVVSPSVKVPTRDDVTIVTPAVDPDVFSFAEPTTESTIRLLFVGRLDDSSNLKGEQILFEAIALVTRTISDLQLEIVGDGTGRARWEATVEERGVSDWVTFSGVLAGSDLVAAYHRATIVVLPSTTEAESFGMCLIEAMSCGRPVIGSRIGGIPFVVDHGLDGLLVTPGDPAALARAIIELSNDPQGRAAMGLQGRLKVESRFSVASMQNSYQNLFAELLTAHGIPVV